jgi:hypothetical protein
MQNAECGMIDALTAACREISTAGFSGLPVGSSKSLELCTDNRALQGRLRISW